MFVHISQVNKLMCGDHHIKDELCYTTSTVTGTVIAITERFGYFNISACYVPQILIDKHNIRKKTTTSKLLHYFRT